jgi:hypothetical protein
MTFPDGRIKNGLFENNVFKGANSNQSVQEQFLNTQVKVADFRRGKSRGNSNSINKELHENQMYTVNEIRNNPHLNPN